MTPPESDQVLVIGTVHFLPVEGGVWAVRGDDKRIYDPAGGLPTDYQQEGLRVRFAARERRDLVSIRMAGHIVEITTIERL